MPLSAKPLQPDSFLDPLHIILTEHDRQRRVAEWLWTHSADQRLAPIQEQIATLLAYLTRDLLLHHRDEETAAFLGTLRYIKGTGRIWLPSLANWSALEGRIRLRPPLNDGDRGGNGIHTLQSMCSV